MTACKEVTDIYEKHSSKEDLAKLHTVAKAVKASPMKNRNKNLERHLRTLLGVHYDGTLQCLGFNNSCIDQSHNTDQARTSACCN